MIACSNVQLRHRDSKQDERIEELGRVKGLLTGRENKRGKEGREKRNITGDSKQTSPCFERVAARMLCTSWRPPRKTRSSKTTNSSVAGLVDGSENGESDVRWHGLNLCCTCFSGLNGAVRIMKDPVMVRSSMRAVLSQGRRR